MAKSSLYDFEDGLNEQTWLCYSDERTKHLKFDIEAWLKSDTNNDSLSRFAIVPEDVESDATVKVKENTPITVQTPPVAVTLFDLKRKKKLEKNIRIPYKFFSRNDDPSCELLDNRSLLEDIQLSFDSSLDCSCDATSINVNKESEIPSITKEREIHFSPEKVSTPEVKIQKYSKLKRNYVQKVNQPINQSGELLQKQSIDRLSEKISDEKSVELNERIDISWEDRSNENNKGVLRLSSPILVEKEFNASEKVSLPSSLHPQELSRSQSLERLSVQQIEEHFVDHNSTFDIPGEELDKQDTDLKIENAANNLTFEYVENTEKQSGEQNSASSPCSHSLNQTFTLESPEQLEIHVGQKDLTFKKNSPRFLIPERITDKKDVMTSQIVHKSNSNAESIEINKKESGGPTAVGPKKLGSGSRLPLPVNRLSMYRTGTSGIPKKI